MISTDDLARYASAYRDHCADAAEYRVRVPDDDVESLVCALHLSDAVHAAHDDLQSAAQVSVYRPTAHLDGYTVVPDDPTACQWIAV
jgi:hypothetical protein